MISRNLLLLLVIEIKNIKLSVQIKTNVLILKMGVHKLILHLNKSILSAMVQICLGNYVQTEKEKLHM